MEAHDGTDGQQELNYYYPEGASEAPASPIVSPPKDGGPEDAGSESGEYDSDQESVSATQQPVTLGGPASPDNESVSVADSEGAEDPPEENKSVSEIGGDGDTEAPGSPDPVESEEGEMQSGSDAGEVLSDDEAAGPHTPQARGPQTPDAGNADSQESGRLPSEESDGNEESTPFPRPSPIKKAEVQVADSTTDDRGNAFKKSVISKKDHDTIGNLSRTSIDDHGELDYDEEVEELDGPKAPEPTKASIKPVKSQHREDKEEGEEDSSEEEGEAHSSDTSFTISTDGELSDDDDFEEGEIKEPGRKPMTKPLCKFFQRGQCTWGNNCRFLHPGINDKGNYSLIERPGMHPNLPSHLSQRLGPRQDSWQAQEVQMPPEEPLPPPPPPEEPRQETAWERGLRTAKELMKKANKRKETDVDFHEKKMNISLVELEEEKDNNKENEKKINSPVQRDPYYDGWEDDDYYTSKADDGWGTESSKNQYENFQVNWRSSPPDFGTPLRNQPGYRENSRGNEKQRDNRYHSPSPRDRRYEDMDRREKNFEDKKQGVTTFVSRGDEWRDPWRRSKSPPKRRDSSSRSRSRGRGPRRKRSYSGSSSYSSSSYSSRSRSRSSSYSSYSSRSSYSRSSSVSSRSRSRSPRRRKKPTNKPPPSGGSVGMGRKPQAGRTGEPPRSTVSMRGDKNSMGPGRRPGSQTMQDQRSFPQQRDSGPPSQRGAQRRGSPIRSGAQQSNLRPIPRVGTVPQRPPPPQRPAEPPPVRGAQPPQRGRGVMATTQRARGGIRAQTNLRTKKRGGSVSSSGSSVSRSRSRSSRSRSASSHSSRSSSVSSSGSSGSADSDNIYRDLGSSGRGKARKNTFKDKKTPEKVEPAPPPREMKPKVPVPSTVAMQGKKDPMKTLGQKSNIKLTLIKKPSDKSGTNESATKKKQPQSPVVPSPTKKPVRSPTKPAVQEKVAQKPPSKPEKTAKPSNARSKPEVPPTKPVPKVSMTIKKPESAIQRPAVTKPTATKTVSSSGAGKKRSTSSRREELLAQLQAVEDAIARKRAKMQ